ncbi:unnamed protein product [Camellia sinensis]
MHPNMHSKPSYADAILNGLEIFKLNQSDGSLAGPNPVYDMVPTPLTPHPKLPGKQNSKTLSSLVVAVAIAGGVIGGVFLILVIGFLIFRQRKRVRDSSASVVKVSWVQFLISDLNINGEDGFMSPSDPQLPARKTTIDDDDDMLFSGSWSNGTGTSTTENGARSGNSFGSHQIVVFSEIINPNGQ